MKNNNAIAVVAAAALLFGAAEASATGYHHKKSGSTNVKNTNVGVNLNKVHNSNSVRNKNVNNVSNNNNNINFNKNHNTNTNTNTNTNKNKNTNNNTNNNTNKNKNTNNNNSSANSNSSGGDGGSSNVTVNGDDAAASGAAPVYLTTSNDTCMGSSGVGGQGMSFGFSVGTTWTDSNCILLKNSRELRAQGFSNAAKARLCMDDDNAMAFELAGNPCPQALSSAQTARAKVGEWNAQYASAGTVTPAATQTAERIYTPAAEIEWDDD